MIASRMIELGEFLDVEPSAAKPGLLRSPTHALIIHCQSVDPPSPINAMPRFYEPDVTAHFDRPFVRDANNKLIRRSYRPDMDDRTLVMVLTNGIGANLTNDETRAHLVDIRREHLIDQVCVQEILLPEK